VRAYAILKVIDTLQMEYKVSAGSDVRKGEFSFIFLDLLQAVFYQYFVLDFEISGHFDLKLICRFFNLDLC